MEHHNQTGTDDLINIQIGDAQPIPHRKRTEYEPVFGDMLIEHMREGYSLESFGAIIRVGDVPYICGASNTRNLKKRLR